MKENMLGLEKGIVVLHEYSFEWEKLFEQERASLQGLLDDSVVEIQHIGSTAVPNLISKPIIDILLGVRSSDVVSQMKSQLEDIGYTYRLNGSDENQVLFVKGPEEKRTYYLHITEYGSKTWKNYLAFRDYLRVHPEAVQKYAELKKELAAHYPQKRELYTQGKKRFIQGVLDARK